MAGGTGSIPGWGAKAPPPTPTAVTQCGQKMGKKCSLDDQTLEMTLAQTPGPFALTAPLSTLPCPRPSHGPISLFLIN